MRKEEWVAEQIQRQFTTIGVEVPNRGNGVLWLNLPPEVRDIDILLADIKHVDGISAIDQEYTPQGVKLKAFISDPNVVLNMSWVGRGVYTYLTSWGILLSLLSSLVLYHYATILAWLEALWIRIADQ